MNIFDEHSSFEKKAIHTFGFQRELNPIYKKFCETLGVKNVKSIHEIPLLSIQAFKEKEILTRSVSNTKLPELYFQSSGTSGMKRSRHFVVDSDLYKDSIKRGIEHFYPLKDFIILAYTPGYNQNPHSSLVYMLNFLIEQDDLNLSRFLEINEPLNQSEIDIIEASGKRVLLFGAAFGLLDLMSLSEVNFPADTIVTETGGMKTYKREMSKSELHSALAEGLGLEMTQIHSEYGMTELLSQAYSLGNEWFKCVPWMKVSIRNAENPLVEVNEGDEGLIGVLDLANQNSCAFILTGDKGLQRENGDFQVLGRWSNYNLRGCNFLIDE